MADNQLERLFKECDAESSGYLCQEGMRQLCSRVSVCAQDADAIFETLDLDGDGKVNFEDISKGLSEFLNQMTGHKEQDGCKTPDSEIDPDKRQFAFQAWQNFAAEVEKTDKTINEEKIFDLYKELQKSGRPQLIFQFETVVQDLLDNVKRLQEENNQLEYSWKKERKQQQIHLHRLEEEMTNQVQDLELKVREKAQQEMEQERKNLKKKMDAEMDELQAHLSLFEKNSGPNQYQDEKLNEVRTKLEEAIHENHQLRMSLMETQTSIALMRSDMAQLKTQYEEKCRELSSERERIIEILHEHDVLGRQLHLLHDANRKLHDTNDSLRGAMDGTTSEIQSSFFSSFGHRGSVIGDYIQNDISSFRTDRRMRLYSEDDLIDEQQELNSLEREERKGDDLGDLDSGLSTLRDLSEELNEETISPIEEKRNSMTPEPPQIEHITARKVRSVAGGENLTTKIPSDVASSQSESAFPRRKIADIKRQLGLDPSKAGPRSLTPIPVPRTSVDGNRRENRSSSTPPMKESKVEPEVSLKVEEKETSHKSKNFYQATGPPERTYKVVFIGDAAVGKSSFILRLSKGVFITQLSSTLGVDFQVKMLKVDGRNVALQLWDTAGQERFRSITQSYFRKADGVMLLYDCTNESSFLNVRQWMEAVDDITSRKIPVMIVANKTDMRDMCMASGKPIIRYEDGEKLAKDFGAIFMETSAKDGSNIFEAVVELARSMAINEDLQVKSSGLLLKESNHKTSGKCCRK